MCRPDSQSAFTDSEELLHVYSEVLLRSLLLELVAVEQERIGRDSILSKYNQCKQVP